MDETRDLGGKLNINGKTYPIYGGLNTVGRNKEAVVNIKSLSVSQHHAIFILVDDDLHFISDLKSSNGTFLDGEPLVGLQLYRIKNGSRVKFADIEGTYSQCTSEDPKHTSPNNSQCTQYYTQSFYGTNTQIINDSSLTNHHDKTDLAQNSSYIPTQVLINVATALETSYEKIHEQPTQLIVRDQNIHELPTQMVNLLKIHENPIQLEKKKPVVLGKLNCESSEISDLKERSVCEVDQSVIDLHEAETQRVLKDHKYETIRTFETSINGIGNVSDYHEMETQLIRTEENERSPNTIPENYSKELQKESNITTNDVLCQDINEGGLVENTGFSSTSQKASVESNKITDNVDYVAPNSSTSIEDRDASNIQLKHMHKPLPQSHQEKKLSQDSDKVHPLGISRNIFVSQNSDDENISDTDSDIIRPVKKKSQMLLSPLQSHQKTNISQDSEQVHPLGISRNIVVSQNSDDDNISDTDSDIIRPLKKKSQMLLPTLHSDQETNLSQESDQVRPLGISRNILVSQNSDDGNISDADSDVIRPVKKKSRMLFYSSQETLIDEHDHNEKTQDEDSNDSLDFMTMQKVADMEKKYLGEDNPVPNDLSDKFNIYANEVEEKKNKTLNCANISQSEGTEENSAAYNAPHFRTKNGASSTVPKTTEESLNEKSELSDSETDIENEVIEKNTSQEQSSETDNEKQTPNELSTINELKNRKSMNLESESGIVKNKNSEYCEKKIELEISFPRHKNSDSSVEKPEISDSDTDNERKMNENVSVKIQKKRKVNMRRKKRNTNVIFKSESETDIDTDIENKNVDTIQPNKMKLNVNNEKGSTIHPNNVIGALDLNNSSFQVEEKLIDETRFEEEILHYSVEPNVNLTSIESGKEEDNIKNKNLLTINESLNDSDIIPATQECVPIRTISQISNLENSEESFRLGLTQLMDEDTEEKCTLQEKSYSENMKNPKETEETSDQTDLVENGGSEVMNDMFDGNQKNSQEIRRKFIFRKKVSKCADVTLDYEDKMHEAQTQSLCDKTSTATNNVNNDHVFLQPSQKLSKKKISAERSIPEEEIYMLCTQKFDGSTNSNDSEDIYLQSTQKLTEKPGNHEKETDEMGLTGDDTYQLSPQQCIVGSSVNNAEMKDHTPERVEQDDDIDMFSTQSTISKTTPRKCLESELEFMFATQRAVPTEESLDKIQDIVLQKTIDNSKLPEQDSDLEAILATQKFPDSPKTTNLAEEKDTNEIMLGRSIESQLEVLFQSQSCNLPPDKFSRPANPLVNIFGKETQAIEPMLSEKNNVENFETSNEETEILECSNTRNGRISQKGLEQSFALLEAKSTRIRRSARNSNCEEVTVSCSKSRKSMAIAPVEKFEKVLKEEVSKLVKEKTRSTTIKRHSSTSSDSNAEVKESKRGRVIVRKKEGNESASISGDDSCPDVNSSSSRSTRSGRASTVLDDINEISDDDFEVEETSTKKLKTKIEHRVGTSGKTFNTRRSTRTNRKPEEDEGNRDINSNDEKVLKPVECISNIKTTTSKVGNKNNIKRSNNNDNSERETLTKTSAKIQEKSEMKVKPKARICDSNSSIVTDNQAGLSSRTTKRGSDVVVSTPSKSRRKTLATTPSTGRKVLENQDSPNRNKRKQKTKVVFTMMENPKLEAVIRMLGGSIVDCVDTCTVLITPSLKRSMKLLSAVGLGKPICSVKWVEDSKEQNQFLDPWDYVLVDKEAETKWDFSLRSSLERSLQVKLFEGYTFQILVTTALDVLKGAIECCGGKIVTRTPKEANNFIVVASPDHKEKYKKLLKQKPNLIIVEPEAIFDGVLRQEIRFESHLLK